MVNVAAIKNKLLTLTLTEWLLVFIAALLAAIAWKLYSLPTYGDIWEAKGKPERIRQLIKASPHIFSRIDGEVEVTNSWAAPLHVTIEEK